MAKEVILFYQNDTYKAFSENRLKDITEKDISEAMYALVSVQGGEVQRYLPIEPEYLITEIGEGSTFSYRFEYSAVNGDYLDEGEEPEMYDMGLHTIELKSVFDIYESIYFLKEVTEFFDIINPSRFDDMMILDVSEIKFDIKKSSKGPIRIHDRKDMASLSITNIRGIRCEDIDIKLSEAFGVIDEFNKTFHNWIRVFGDNRWALQESFSASDAEEINVVGYPIDTGALVFIDINTLNQLRSISDVKVTIIMYDMGAVPEGIPPEDLPNYISDQYIEDQIINVIVTSLISPSSVITFILESKFYYQCAQFIMELHDFCNVNGVMFTMSWDIEKKIETENGIERGILKSKIPTTWSYDYGIVRDDDPKPLEKFMNLYLKSMHGSFRYEDSYVNFDNDDSELPF